ncbi:MAG: adenylate/guanylate cyclase domain-containing protein, partial [Armatimonadota bacterium]
VTDAADRAAIASIDMLFALDKVKADFKQRGFPTIDIGMGLNTGPMSVGNMGSIERFCYTVMGDAVNLGARLEGLTKEYGVKILISEFTRRSLKSPNFLVRDLDDIRVKGKLEPVKVFELIRPDYIPRPELIKELIGHFEQGRKHYLAQAWDQAAHSFNECLRIRPEDGPTNLYQKRIEDYKVTTPHEGWDGVYTFHHK